jgi:hypothetical protein
LSQLIDRRFLAEEFHGRVLTDIPDPRMFANAADELQGFRRFLFGEKIDLEIQVLPLLGALALPALLHQNESRKQNRLRDLPAKTAHR